MRDMNWIRFYDDLAKNTSDKSCQNGRMFSLDRKIHQKIFNDINKKMQFNENDVVLDIGCGNGAIAKIIAPFVKKMVLLDGSVNLLEKARMETSGLDNISLHVIDINKGAGFAGLGEFDKILCYSVIQCLDIEQRIRDFLREAVGALSPGGKMLVGDIPLAEKKREYLAERRKKLLLNFLANMRYVARKHLTDFVIKKANHSAIPQNAVILEKHTIKNMLKDLDIHGISFSFLEQDKSLPFSNSREDLLIVKHALKA